MTRLGWGRGGVSPRRRCYVATTVLAGTTGRLCRTSSTSPWPQDSSASTSRILRLALPALLASLQLQSPVIGIRGSADPADRGVIDRPSARLSALVPALVPLCCVTLGTYLSSLCLDFLPCKWRIISGVLRTGQGTVSSTQSRPRMLSPWLLSPSSRCRWGDPGTDPDDAAQGHEWTSVPLKSVRLAARGFYPRSALPLRWTWPEVPVQAVPLLEASFLHPQWGTGTSQNEEQTSPGTQGHLLCSHVPPGPPTSPQPRLQCGEPSPVSGHPRRPWRLVGLPGGQPSSRVWLVLGPLSLACAWQTGMPLAWPSRHPSPLRSVAILHTVRAAENTSF